jgi:hypothetical protein
MKALSVKSREVKAVRTSKPRAESDPKDKQFIALLRRKCMRAATIGALTAAAESLPGFGKALGLVFGELLDVEMLAGVQRELVEETFALYGLELPTALHGSLVRKVQLAGSAASVAGDALTRSLLHRAFGSIGRLIAARAVPIAAVVSSAFANATVTYAIGKRAQAVARLRESPIAGMPDALRAFTGVDERRIFAWSVAAAKDALTRVTSTVAGMARQRAKPPKRKTPRRARRADQRA